MKTAFARRARLIRYFGVERTDLSVTKRDEIVEKIMRASDASLLTDRPCVGKHWFVMNFDDRATCPYCDWRLTT